MTRAHRIALWGVPLLLLLAIAYLRPHPVAALRTAVLVLATFAGAYALGRAAVELAARRIGWMQGAGSVLFAAGLFLIGARYLPAASAHADALMTAGTASFVVGILLQIRALPSR